jgi:hypothetical protein
LKMGSREGMRRIWWGGFWVESGGRGMRTEVEREALAAPAKALDSVIGRGAALPSCPELWR